MGLFGKKPKRMDMGAPGSPMQQIMAMQQQGLDNNTIVQELQRQGYNSSQIFDAMNQASMMAAGPLPGEMHPDMGMMQNYSMPPQQQQMNTEEQPQISKDLVEEIAEAIIDEKWKEFEDDLKKIIEWKDKTDARLAQLSQQIQDVADSLNGLHKNILNKISDYDRNIIDVGTEIKAMEKVFQKVLPSLTENVNKLERMAKGIKDVPTARKGI